MNFCWLISLVLLKRILSLNNYYLDIQTGSDDGNSCLEDSHPCQTLDYTISIADENEDEANSFLYLKILIVNTFFH
jgi:hypothetical protein